MKKIKEDIKELRAIADRLESEVEMQEKKIETFEEFEEVLSSTGKSDSTLSRWKKGWKDKNGRFPDPESLEYMHKNGIDVELWFDIQWSIKQWKAESAKRKVLLK